MRRVAKVNADLTHTPTGHTQQGGVIVGRADAKRSMILFEDPQCPYCRQFEELNGSAITTAIAAGVVAVEYRMRCFLGPESVRADNALALAAEAGHFDQLRKAVFRAQPPESTGGFTVADLLALGEQIGLADPNFVAGVRGGRYESWVLRQEKLYRGEDPQGTPAAWLDGAPLDTELLFDPPKFARRLGG